MLRVQDAVLILLRHAGCRGLALEEELVPEVHSGTHQLDGPRESHLARCIDNLGGKVLALVPYRFGKGILDRGVVAIYKVPIDELHRQ